MLKHQHINPTLDQIFDPPTFRETPEDVELCQRPMPILLGRRSAMPQTTENAPVRESPIPVNAHIPSTYFQYASLVQGGSSSLLEHGWLSQGVSRQTSRSPMMISAAMNTPDAHPIMTMQTSAVNEQLFQLYQEGNLHQGLPAPQHTSFFSALPSSSIWLPGRSFAQPLQEARAPMANALEQNGDDLIMNKASVGTVQATTMRGGLKATASRKNKEPHANRFRSHQSEHWRDRFAELVAYREKNGHCLVPNAFKDNVPLAEWVKRQRYQYKLKRLGHHSSMTDDRIRALEGLGFVWNSHDEVWEERFNDLTNYKAMNGNCNVPTSGYKPNPQLGVWVKVCCRCEVTHSDGRPSHQMQCAAALEQRQRRQFKLLNAGKPSTMTPSRVQRLDEIGFSWHLLHGRKRSDRT